MSSDSLIKAVPSPGDADTENVNSKDNNDDSENTTSAFVKMLKTIPALILDLILALLNFLFDIIVKFVAAFVTAVMTQPNVQAAFETLIVNAMGAFIDQDDFGEKFDSAVRRVIYDKERRREASRDIGKEMLPLVSGFVGGVADSLRPNFSKKSKKKNFSTTSEISSSMEMGSIGESSHDSLLDQKKSK